MYAVIETGGKQYRVQPGDIVQVEKLEGEKGASLKLNQVLFASKANGDQAPTIWLGKPVLSGAAVEAEVVGQGRGEKILIIKMKRRKQYRRTQGHRQEYTQLLITSVDNGAGEKATLSAEDKKAKLAKFQSHLAPRGFGHTPKTLGSRKRMAQAAAAGNKAASAEGVSKKTAPKAKAAAGKTASAKKKAPAKKKAE